MAHYFFGLVNCGDGEAVAKEAAAAFGGWNIDVAPGVVAHCRSHVSRGEDHRWQVAIIPVGSSYSHETRPELLEPDARWAIAAAIYAKLKTLRGYALARVGWEPEGWLDLVDGEPIRIDRGVVVRADLAERVDQPELLEPFSEGYLWQPLTRETLPNM